MSLIPHTHFPRSKFDMDFWHRPDIDGIGPSTLDLFDPFDELDHAMSRNLAWINKPDFLNSVLPREPRVPHRYRISVDCTGYNPNSIQTKLSEDKRSLIVTGRESDKKSDEDYSMREFKKTYKLPHDVETDKMVSFMTGAGNIVIEMPVRRDESQIAFKDEGFPTIVDGENGQKQLQLHLAVPSNVDPSKLKVTCKDRDLIVQAEDRQVASDSMSGVYYYRRSTLPENTDFKALKCSLDNNKLSITAPIKVHSHLTHHHHHHHHHKRVVPIETNEHLKLNH